jgi:integrase/recombinase XerD
MANAKIILDTRRAKSDGSFNVAIRVTHFKKVYTINSNVSVMENHWNEKNSEVTKAHPNFKLLNLKISKDFFSIQKAILSLEDEFSIEDLRNIRAGKPKCKEAITFKSFADELIFQMIQTNKTGNALVYQTAVNRFITYCGKDVAFVEINYTLLDQFSHHLLVSGLKQNSVSNYFRSIRAIYNKAIKQKLVDRSHYPFYDISIKSEKTVKRAIFGADICRLEQILCTLESVPEKHHTVTWRSLNCFLLSYYLIGMSFTDLAYLKPENIVDGRVVYKRRKTHKYYSIKLFPKAEKALSKMASPNSKYLLPILPEDVPENSLKAKKLIRQWIKTTNKYLKRLSVEAEIKGGVTTYVSRHTWATTAKRLGYSNELIAEALGHEIGNKITNIYLDSFDKDVVDAMHQRVISL